MKRFSCLVVLCALFGCSSSSESERLSYVEGRAVKGNLADASAEVWSVGDNGAPQRLLGSTTTGSNGDLSVSFTGYEGWTCVVVWGGTYTDEATGATSTIPQSAPLMGVAYASPTPTQYIVSPVTTVMTQVAKDDARDPAITFDTAVSNAAIKMELTFGVPNPHLTVPVDLTAGPASPSDGALYGAILAGFSVCALDMGVTGGEFTYGVAKDARDGKFDGHEWLDPVQLNLSTTLDPNILTLLAFFTPDWLDNSAQNMSGLGSADLPGLSALSAAMDAIPSGPRIDAVWNAHSTLAGGNEVTVLGAGFSISPTVEVGGTPVTPTFASDTEIRFNTPAFSVAANYDLDIKNALSLSYNWLHAVRYYDESAAPTVTGMVPAEGPVVGGTPVRITGTNLDPDTRVFFGDTEALVTGDTCPRELVAISPKADDAGAVTVRVENGASLSATAPGSFNYKKKDVGRTFDDSDLSGSYSALYQRYFYTGSDFTIQAGTATWQLDGAGQGTFTRTESTMIGGAATPSTASGGAFATAEGQNGQVLTVDSGTNATNLFAFTIHPDGSVGSGLTAYGPVTVFKHGTGLDDSALAGEYAVAGSYATQTPELAFATGAGTIQFDGAGGGGINLKLFERQGEGTGFRTWTITVPLNYSVTSNGGLTVQLDPSSANPWNATGRVSPDGALAGFQFAGTGTWQGTAAFFQALRLEDDVASEDFRGEFGGGTIGEKTIVNGTTYAEALGTVTCRLLETEGGEGRYYGTRDGGAQAPGPLDKPFQRGGVRVRYAGPFGQVRYGDGASSGYMAPRGGYWIEAGRVAESVDTTAFDDRIEFGLHLRYDSHFSKFSSFGTYNVVNWNSRWDDPGTPITGNETNETSIGSFTFNSTAPVTVGGKAFSGFGTYDGYTASAKFVVRDGLSASVTFGPSTDYQATFAYGYLKDRYTHVIAEVDGAGPLGSYKAGTVWGVGAVSPTGAFGGYASTASLDWTSYTAFAPQRTFTLGATYKFGSSLYDFDGSSGATLGRVERGTVSVSGTDLTLGYQQSLFTEGAAGSSTSAGTRPGMASPNANGTVDFDYGSVLLGGFTVGDGDMFVMTDFTDSFQTGIHVMVKDATSMPPLFDYGVTGFMKMFSDTNLPALTALQLRQGTYTPRNNLISFVALDEYRYNDRVGTVLGRQFNNGTNSADATGGYTWNLGSVDYSGAITPDGCFGFGLEGPDNEAPTSMGIMLHLGF